MTDPIVHANRPVPVELEAGQRYFFCACGRSANQPFCDGSHKETDITPIPFEAKETGTAYLCQCKQTQNAPYCDGTHKQVPDDRVGQPFKLGS